MVAWYLLHNADLLHARVRGAHGLTPWTRIKGRPYGCRLVDFCEIGWFQLPTSGLEADERGNAEMRLEQGMHLGFSRTNEYRFAFEDRIKTFRCIAR